MVTPPPAIKASLLALARALSPEPLGLRTTHLDTRVALAEMARDGLIHLCVDKAGVYEATLKEAACDHAP